MIISSSSVRVIAESGPAAALLTLHLTASVLLPPRSNEFRSRANFDMRPKLSELYHRNCFALRSEPNCEVVIMHGN